MTYIDNMMRDQHYYNAPKDMKEYEKWRRAKYSYLHENTRCNREDERENDCMKCEPFPIPRKKKDPSELFDDDELNNILDKK